MSPVSESTDRGLRPPIRKGGKKSKPLIWAEYALFRLIAGAFRKASPEAVERWGRRAGRLFGRVLRRRTRLAGRNLERVFPGISPGERDRIVDACWQHYGRTTFEFMHSIDEPIESIAERFDLSEDTRAALVQLDSSGGIFATAHFGSWEFAIAILAQLLEGEKAAVARPLDNPWIDEHLNRARLRAGVQMIDRRNAARPLMQILGRGGIVGMVPDQAVKPREGLLVPFLGVPAWTTSAPAKLALRYDLPIYCFFAWPEPHGRRLRLEVDSPIIPSRLPEEQRTTEFLTAQMNELISRRIRQNPELWLWMHDRWKGAPTG
ncbi:MAG: lysophospholipid acyltransferase family protein [Thermoanaerobaculia bacterium]